MGVLVLLALIGLGMMVSTRAERLRIPPQREALALDAVMDRAVQLVRQRLREDLLRDPNRVHDPNILADPNWLDPNELLGADPNDPNGNGAPIDAPGPLDPWLASTIPWPLGHEPNFGDMAFIQQRLTAAKIPAPGNVFVWPRVSYLGPPPQDPNWALLVQRLKLYLSETHMRIAGDDALTNRLTVEAEPNLFTGFILPGDPNLFRLMLFDADGDGMPDAPVSFTFPVDTTTPTTTPRRVHVTIRIVDNCSKINVNTAGVHDPVHEHRGRFVNDIVLDPNHMSATNLLMATLDAHKWLANDSDPNSILGYRADRLAALGVSNALQVVRDPNLYMKLCRSPLFAGTLSGLYASDEECGLTRRNSLLSRQGWMSPDGLSLLERALYRTVSEPLLARWNRMLYSADYMSSFMNPSVIMPEGMFRRCLFTTRSYDTQRRGKLTLPAVPQEFLLKGKGDPIRIAKASEAALLDWEKFDLNSMPPAKNEPQVRQWLATLATYLYGGYIVPSTGWPIPATRAIQRELNAWQLALNIWDYANADPNVTFLTPQGSPSTVLVAGVKRQPFLTEAYVVWMAADDGSGTVVLTPAYAVEMFVPPGWTIDTTRYALRSGSTLWYLNTFPGTPSTIVGSANGDYHVFCNVRDVPPAGPGLIPSTAHINATFVMGANGLELVHRPDTGGTVQPYPVDRVDNPNDLFWSMPAASGFSDGDWQYRTLQRNTNGWRFTSAAYWARTSEKKVLGDPTQLPSLGAINQIALQPANDPNVTECYWWFKNLPSHPNDLADPNHWAFDSPADLSRVLLVGNDPCDANFTTTWRLFTAERDYRLRGLTETDRLAGVGRLDFFLQDPNVDPNYRNYPPDSNDPCYAPGNAFNYLTALGIDTDGIDNDGDGVIDEPTEAFKTGYRIAGRININTAPEFVLRSVPFFYDDRNTVFRDPAARIVTWRESRPVISPCALAASPKLLTQEPPGRAIRWFRSVGDLRKLQSTRAQALTDPNLGYALDYYAKDNADLIDMPDYDARNKNDPNERNNVKDDVRERDIILSRVANLLTVRSDTYTVYIALIDSEPNPDGTWRYLRRCQFTLDRSNCFRDIRELPSIFGRVESNYYDDTR